MANKSGIHINPKHKGEFTKKAKAAGMSVQAYAKHVSAHPDSYSAKTRKQAGFAKASRKFKHQAGGQLPLAQTTTGASSIADQYDMIGSNFSPAGNFDAIDPNAAAGVQASGPNDQASNPGAFSNSPVGRKIMDRHQQTNAYIKDANLGITAVTDVANAIQGQKQKREEYLQLLRSQTPKFMTNANANGLNNMPAYTMFGGEDRMMTSMMFGGNNSAGYEDYSGMTNEQYGRLGIGRNDSFWGTHGSIYKNGGQVISSKAKEILRDGTANGHKLTDKQKRYFGWLAGGAKAQAGADVAANGPVQQSAPQQAPPPPAADPSKYNADNAFDRYYGANATLSYYKNKLNDKLKAKNTQGFTDYFKGLQGARATGKPADADSYIQGSGYNDYLSPDEVKQTLGSDYDKYIASLKQVNQYNVSQGQKPLYGNIEGESDDVTKLNYGRRFASLQVNPRYGGSDTTTGKSYARQYTYNPQTGNVDLAETGDTSLRPQNVLAQHQAGGQASTLPAAYVRYPDRMKRYRDSLDLYNSGRDVVDMTNKILAKNRAIDPRNSADIATPDQYESVKTASSKGNVPFKKAQQQIFNDAMGYWEDYNDPKSFNYDQTPEGHHVDQVGLQMMKKSKATGIMPTSFNPEEGLGNYVGFNKPTRPGMSKTPIQGREIIGQRNPVVANAPGNVRDLAGGPSNFSYSGMDEHGQQVTRYFPNLESWQRGTDEGGYLHRDVSNNGANASATGYQRQNGGYAEGDEVELTPAQVKKLKRLGYKIETI